MKHTADKILLDFAIKVKNVTTLDEAQKIVDEIVLAAAHDSDLISESLNRVNTKFDWAAAIEKVQSNMSEL